jgi:uncharacterized protein YdeI (YjbR/CyaY-like superfamily)
VPTELPLLSFEHAADWSAWLADHHAAAPGVWLSIAKAGGGATSVSYSEALDEALCYGWIDGQKGALDDTHWRQRFTPRGPRSRWSQINRDRVEALIAAGRMRPAGLHQVQLAQADGRWDAAYPSSRSATVPDDLRAALDAQPGAAAFFETLTSANRYAILYRVHEAKRPATRAARIEKFVAMLARGETLH